MALPTGPLPPELKHHRLPGRAEAGEAEADHHEGTGAPLPCEEGQASRSTRKHSSEASCKLPEPLRYVPSAASVLLCAMHRPTEVLPWVGA